MLETIYDLKKLVRDEFGVDETKIDTMFKDAIKEAEELAEDFDDMEEEIDELKTKVEELEDEIRLQNNEPEMGGG